MEQQTIGGSGDGLLRPRQAAEWLGVSTRWLELRRFRGGGPVFIRLGGPYGRVRYSRQDLDAYVSEHRRTSTSDRGESGAAELARVAPGATE